MLPTRVDAPRLLVVVGVGLAGAVVLAAVAVVGFRPSDGGSELLPLPAGPPHGGAIASTTTPATLADMNAKAPIVFVGTVEAVGGWEVVSPASETEGPELTVYRTRFAVSRVIRGDVSATVDITQFDGEHPSLLDVGATYLVFAETRLLGSTQTPALVPFGYYQGIYKQLSDEHFSNDTNGDVRLDQISRTAADG